MNNEQNQINSIRNSDLLKDLQVKIAFMKPIQTINLDRDIFYSQLIQNTKEAEEFWKELELKIKKIELPILKPHQKNIIQIENASNSYIKKINKETLLATFLFEKIELLGLRPLKIFIYDLKIVFFLSYVRGFQYVEYKQNDSFDLIIHSDEIHFILENEFGWDALTISGAFKIQTRNLKKINSFFRWQQKIKQGFSYRYPVVSFRLLVSFICKYFSKFFYIYFNKILSFKIIKS